MRYHLRTLLIVAGIAPPAIAFLWFHWLELLIFAVVIIGLCLWVWGSYAMARFFAEIVASVMG